MIIIICMLKTAHDVNKLEVGMDEAGYGAFYGRVYAAAVIWPHNFNHPLIRDSKTLNPNQRDEAYQIVIKHAIAFGVAYRESIVIDQINIRKANFQAMHEAIDKCRLRPDLILVDGNVFEPYMDRAFEPVAHMLVVKGDQTYAAIAAASILAKVSRDRYILAQCHKHPQLIEHYHLDRNKGYGAKVHRDGLAKYGWTDDHRKVGFSEKYVEPFAEKFNQKAES